MAAKNPTEDGVSKSEKARRQRRAIRESKRNMRKVHREFVQELARPGAEGHEIGCQCEACGRARSPQYWAKRDAWQAAHPGGDWYLRDMDYAS
jgi:hypothetical protein